jgi:cytochrome c-type biogenesis protein CcmH/NrfG
MIEFVHDLQKKQFAPVAPTVSPRWQSFAIMLGLALMVYLAAALGAELLMFDDAFYFGPEPENPEFVAGFTTVATQPIANAYLPVAHLSLWFDYKLGAGSSFLPHMHALLLHGLAGVMLARLLLQLGVSRTIAHIAAALFVVHPALCESVAWVSSRKYVLSGLFTFAALYQTVRFAQVASLWRAGLLAVLAAAAMFSNATSVVLPLLSVGVVMWSQGPRVRWIAPAVLFAVTVPIALYHQSVAAAQGTLVAADAMERLQQAPGAFWHYLRTAVWPAELNVLYPEINTLAVFREQWVAGVIAVSAFAVCGVVFWFWRSTRVMAAGLLTFVVALLPFNTAFPASAIAAADRYLYLAVPGLALAIVALTALVHRRGPWLAAALALPLAWLAGSRAHDFQDEATLWQTSLAVDEDNAVAHINRAVAIWNSAGMERRELPIEDYERHLQAAITAARYPIHELNARRKLLPLQMGRADYEGAAANAMAAIAAAKAQLASENTAPRIDLASAGLLQIRIESFEPLQLSGNEFAADEVLAAVKAQAPESPDVIAFQALRDLAGLRDELLALANAGKAPRLAKDDPRGLAVDAVLAAAIKLHEDHHGLWLSQALWNQARDKTTAALRCFKKATELRPDAVTGWLSAARMLREKSMYSSALKYAQDGWRNRRDPRLLQELALSLVGLNRLKDAERYMSAYMQLEPDDKDSGKILANLLIGRAYTLLSDQSQRATVRKLVADALRYNADETKAHLVLGRLAHEEKKFATAVRHLEIAFELLPTFDDARKQLTRSLAALGFAQLFSKNEEGTTDAWLRCLEVAPTDFDKEAVERQLKLAWTRLEGRGLKRSRNGDIDGAIADFRRCLKIDPEMHWAAWLLATALQAQENVDLVELEGLCRKALAFQLKNGIDASRQSYLLATTLQRQGNEDEAREVAIEYLKKPSEDADSKVLEVLKALAGS